MTLFNRIVALFFTVASCIPTHATIASLTTMESANSAKKIIFLEDCHNLSKDIDKQQHNKLNRYFADNNIATALILEIRPLAKSFYEKCRGNIFTKILTLIMVRMYREWPALFPAYTDFSLLAEMYINSIDLLRTWPKITTYPIDQRDSIDALICLLIQKLGRISNDTVAEIGYKRGCGSQSLVNYSWESFKSQPNIFQGLYVQSDFISLLTYQNHLATLNTALNDHITALEAKRFIPASFATSLRNELKTTIQSAEKLIKKHQHALPEKTLNHLVIALFEQHKTFNAAWPHIENFWKPSLMICDLAMLESILEQINNPEIQQVIVFAGMKHTENLQNYLTHLGYNTAIQKNIVYLQADENSKKTGDTTQEKTYEKLHHNLEICLKGLWY